MAPWRCMPWPCGLTAFSLLCRRGRGRRHQAAAVQAGRRKGQPAHWHCTCGRFLDGSFSLRRPLDRLSTLSPPFAHRRGNASATTRDTWRLEMVHLPPRSTLLPRCALFNSFQCCVLVTFLGCFLRLDLTPTALWIWNVAKLRLVTVIAQTSSLRDAVRRQACVPFPVCRRAPLPLSPSSTPAARPGTPTSLALRCALATARCIFGPKGASPPSKSRPQVRSIAQQRTHGYGCLPACRFPGTPPAERPHRTPPRFLQRPAPISISSIDWSPDGSALLLRDKTCFCICHPGDILDSL